MTANDDSPRDGETVADELEQNQNAGARRKRYGSTEAAAFVDLAGLDKDAVIDVNAYHYDDEPGASIFATGPRRVRR